LNWRPGGQNLGLEGDGMITMNSIRDFLGKHGTALFGAILIAAFTGGLELYSGRSPWGPDGRFGWWESDIWSSENSQRVADAYSFSHFIHGILFYGFLWWVARKLSWNGRFLIALALEASWELLENSPFIINRYREATISLGYEGDSVLNSVSDIVTAGLGFFFASRVWVSASVVTVFVLEIACLCWVRDNLTLNVIMLVRPVPAIKQWQEQGRKPSHP
jgi:Protein of unknown function (DUF2585)